MTNMTAEEATRDRVAKLGEEAGIFTRNLESQLFALRDHWRTYIGLFGTNNERIDLLNSVSGSISGLLQTTLYESALLSICRLTDPKEARRKKRAGTPGRNEKNVTVLRLVDYLPPEEDPELERLITMAVEKAQFAHTFRNKRLAHLDDDAFNRVIIISPGSRKEMRDAMDAIAASVKRFALTKLGVHLVTHPIAGLQGDAADFLTTLYRGKSERKRLEDEGRKLSLAGDWKAGRELTKLPDWLTFRPDDEIDI